MRRLLPLLALCSSLAALAAGCGDSDRGGSAQALGAGDVIGMKALHFKPDHVQVPVGQKITWKNDESVPHDVKADSGADFASKTFGKDGTYAFTPTTAGTIKYECTLHPGMDGTIDVVAK
ncbi:Amicyanin [Baekduia alba]|uniref:cupredoxin domain-containing protein n=1 Tax=Baekduia alba TaxID=2997333 RepID=UPI00233F99EA|nr:plastocyanin/azurin family copper-binding protein [Baekduia alba]WCB91638.1 Amicyanin [Baekduia alba]